LAGFNTQSDRCPKTCDYPDFNDSKSPVKRFAPDFDRFLMNRSPELATGN
jgi:hypothetical protein